jgi:hypothetical protein
MAEASGTSLLCADGSSLLMTDGTEKLSDGADDGCICEGPPPSCFWCDAQEEETPSTVTVTLASLDLAGTEVCIGPWANASAKVVSGSVNGALTLSQYFEGGVCRFRGNGPTATVRFFYEEGDCTGASIDISTWYADLIISVGGIAHLKVHGSGTATIDGESRMLVVVLFDGTCDPFDCDGCNRVYNAITAYGSFLAGQIPPFPVWPYEPEAWGIAHVAKGGYADMAPNGMGCGGTPPDCGVPPCSWCIDELDVDTYALFHWDASYQSSTCCHGILETLPVQVEFDSATATSVLYQSILVTTEGGYCDFVGDTTFEDIRVTAFVEYDCTDGEVTFGFRIEYYDIVSEVWLEVNTFSLALPIECRPIEFGMHASGTATMACGGGPECYVQCNDAEDPVTGWVSFHVSP